MEALIWIDWVIIGIIGISTLISLKRGFVREAMSLVIWVGAFIIARTFHPNMQALLEGTVETPMVRLVAAFAILFFGTLLIGAIVNNALGQLIRITGLSATDRVLGTFFGLARGVLVVVVALALLRMTPVTEDTWWRESATVGEFVRVEEWSRDVLGDDIEQFLPGTEDEQQPSQDMDETVRDGAQQLMEQRIREEFPEDMDAQTSSNSE